MKAMTVRPLKGIVLDVAEFLRSLRVKTLTSDRVVEMEDKANRSHVGSSFPSPASRCAFQACHLVMKFYFGKHAAHWRAERQVTVMQWCNEGQQSGKMWALFDDGEVELRWAKTIVAV